MTRTVPDVDEQPSPAVPPALRAVHVRPEHCAARLSGSRAQLASRLRYRSSGRRLRAGSKGARRCGRGLLAHLRGPLSDERALALPGRRAAGALLPQTCNAAPFVAVTVTNGGRLGHGVSFARKGALKREQRCVRGPRSAAGELRQRRWHLTPRVGAGLANAPLGVMLQLRTACVCPGSVVVVGRLTPGASGERSCGAGLGAHRRPRRGAHGYRPGLARL